MPHKPSTFLILLLTVALILTNRTWIASHIGLANPQNDQTEFSRRMKVMHEMMDPQIPPGSTIMLGDSITQSFYPRSSELAGAVNFGVGSNTSLNLLEALPIYSSLSAARVIVLQIGRNDLYKRSAEETIANIRKVLETLPRGPRVLINGIFPMNALRAYKNMSHNSEVETINTAIKAMCADGRCTMIDVSPMADAAGVLKEEYDFGDGLHLSKLGYEKWEGLITELLR
jgi:lysophospholipase L1-like esterase